MRADMLEHADRHDAVEAPRVAQRKVAIVDEFEGHAVGESGLRRARLRQRELFLGQGDAVDGDVGEFCQRDRHAAPAAADVEHPPARRERALGRGMRLLPPLRSAERSGGKEWVSTSRFRGWPYPER